MHLVDCVELAAGGAEAATGAQLFVDGHVVLVAGAGHVLGGAAGFAQAGPAEGAGFPVDAVQLLSRDSPRHGEGSFPLRDNHPDARLLKGAFHDRNSGWLVEGVQGGD